MNINGSLTIAVSKGRILTEAMPILEKLDITPVEDPARTRKLVLKTNQTGVKIIIIRATDVPTYVEYGAADMGIAGKDVLMEYTGNGVYEPLDLQIALCKMVLAEPRQRKTINGRLRVATKYVNTTRNYFAGQGKQVEIIKLYGSMELAPVLGLADQIVDLVDTGNTLKVNGLVPVETIAEISSRVIVNKAAMKMKYQIIKPMLKEMNALAGKK
ncbi:MAG: ATP phosphoribosyltransferase [Gammaproteobacteria bacterium RIFCSPLOWO2_01_FULL_47_190]|nr:MAG: ATP phosphoribosyltransferase [Gammaproteobacteria bacterium RIFCSPLOWO2_01_FULL_47_190]